jgi:hypothetical protein
MPASEAQIKANQANSKRSTGPTSPSGKEASRTNSYKHGLTGSGIVLPEREAAEVQRRYGTFARELKPDGEIGLTLVLQAARMSVRMEVCADHQTAMATERVRKALAEIEYPQGIDEAGATKLRAEVAHRAMFDTSPEAILARKYEAATERSFFRALKELRQMEKAAKAAEAEMIEQKLASFLPGDMTDEEFDKICLNIDSEPLPKAAQRVQLDDFAELRARVDVPFSIGKRR